MLEFRNELHLFMPVGRALFIALAVTGLIVGPPVFGSDAPIARECVRAARETCPALRPVDPNVSFNSSALRSHRVAGIPPWRQPVGPSSRPASRLMTLLELASRGQRPALPNWRRDPAAKSNPSPFATMTMPRRYASTLYPAHIPDPEQWAAVIEAVQVGEACPCPLTQADGPGRVPNGADYPGIQLTINKIPGDTKLAMSWGDSCSPNVVDYSIQEGHVGFWYNHKERRCSTNGQTSWNLEPRANSRYYLIVPINDVAEGSYGTDSDGVQRPPGFFICRQNVLAQACAP